MTGKEFSETGLSKLTPEELAALNQWLRSHSVATLEDARYAPGAAMTAAAAGDLRGFEDRTLIKSGQHEENATWYLFGAGFGSKTRVRMNLSDSKGQKAP